MRAPLSIRVGERGDQVRTREIAPHALEAAALYSVVSRLDRDDLPEGLSLVEKALLFDQGYLRDGDERIETEEFDFDPNADDGVHGIPVTFTRDVIAELLNTLQDRSHPELVVENVLMPRDILNGMAERLHDAPMFSRAERREFEDRLVSVKNHVFSEQEVDVIDAIMHEKRVEPETVEEYVEHVYAWATDSVVETDQGESEPDPLKMKIFEIEHLGRFSQHEYDGTTPMPPVRTFRKERIITALNRHAWQNRTEDFAIDDVNILDIPVVSDVLETHGWSDVSRIYEDFDPEQWDDPPANTETATVKARTIETLVSEFGYSRASAELTTRHIMGQVSYRWD